MEIDPRLQNIPPRADTYASVQLSPYTLNPIREPQPQSANLPSLAQDAGHPYYNIPQDRRPQTVQPRSSEEQRHLDLDPTKPIGQGDERNGDNKRPRACEACRGLKVRCEPDPTQGTCRRCAKAGRQCVVTAPSRKRQKKTDTRVAELEKKIDALTASLHATKDEMPSEDDSYEEDEVREVPTVYGVGQPFHSDKSSRKRRRSDHQENQVETRATDTSAVNETSSVIVRGIASSQPPLAHVATQSSGLSPIPPIDPSLPGYEFADVVDRKILDAATAANIFYHYTTNMAKHMPAVVFPENINAGEIRRTKPTLFLAILSVASGRDYPDVQHILLREVIRVYADSIVCRGEKSLELIQALQISSIWYLPEDHNDAKPYQLIHMAAVMAMAIGLGRKKRVGKAPFAALWKDSQQHKNPIIDSTTIESRRAWLSCYAISANFAMAVRQPTLYRWNSYIDESVNTLENSSDAAPSDRVLCQWVRRQHLVEEVMEKLHIDELIDTTSTSDPIIHNILKTFEESLDSWRKNIPEEVVSLSLTLGYHVANLYVRQMGIRLEHSTENLDGSRNQHNPCSLMTENAATTSAPQTDTLKTCLTTVHKVLDTFLSFTIEDIRTIPVLHFIRMAFATVTLFRIYDCAIVPNSELGKVLPAADLKVEMYLNRLLELLQAAATERKSRPAQSFRVVLMMLKSWFELQKNGQRPNQTQLADQELKLHAQPVDTERNTPRLGYRKISMQTHRSLEDATRASSTVDKRHPKQEGQGFQKHSSHPTPPAPNIGNTPLDLLSRVATSDQSTAVHHQQLAMNAPQDTWYPSYPDHLATHNNPSQIPYADNNQPYYPVPDPYTDPSNAYDAPYQGLDPNQSLEQAIGMAFGGEGDFCGMMMDDGLLGFAPGTQVGFSQGYGGVWDGGGQ